MSLKSRVISVLVLALVASAPFMHYPGAQQRGQPPPPQPTGPRLKALVVSGGCCHDYTNQDKILMETIRKILPVDWMVAYQGGTGSNVMIPLYSDPNWFKGYDIIVHNECYADIADEAFIRTITAAQKAGVPTMVLHCSMHSYRSAKIDDWRELLGVTSRRHTRAHQISVKMVAKDDPIIAGLKEDWVTPTDELYVIEKAWPNTKTLASAVSPEEGNAEYPVVWTSEYGGARVFGTTLGHGDTWNEPVFQELLQRGFKWAVKR